MENKLYDFDWANVGMFIGDGEPIQEEFIPVVTTVEKEKQTKMNRSMKYSIMAIVAALIITVLSVVVANAGLVYFVFTVVEVTDTVIKVEDEHGDVFLFGRFKSPKVEVGDEVMACSDLTWQGDKTWKWNTSRTAIISVR